MTLIGGRFRLEERIGKGGMGTVHLAMDTQTDRHVAIKSPLPRYINTPDIERFHREAEALRQLAHPNIVGIIETIEEEDAYYIVMEYVDGGDLHERIRAGGLSLTACLEICLDITDALTRTHRLGIVHRDLKPTNVLLTRDGQVKLTDFGIAHFNSSGITAENEVLGTLEYIAPEMLATGIVDTRSDIWSFGILLYEMLVGRSPFKADHNMQIMKKILYDPLPDLEAQRPDLPVELIDLIYRMLEKDPKSRIETIRRVGYELETYLSRLLSGEPAPVPIVVDYGRSSQAEGSDALPSVNILTPPGELPTQSTPFVGRKQEVQDVAGLMYQARVRLLTILAPGGMGKTRLAIEVADRLRQDSMAGGPLRFEGIHYISLDSVNDGLGIVKAIASSVGYMFEADRAPNPPDADTYLSELIAFIRPRTLLMVLDQFEHLTPHGAMLNRLQAAVPGLYFIVTSRERLNIDGEEVYMLVGMKIVAGRTAADVADSPAAALFVQSARRVRPSFRLEDSDVANLTRICQLLDGTPLAIVLAATWVEMLSLDEIAAELASSLDLLTTTRQQIPERQRSMLTVLDYSWRRMPERLQQIAVRLTVLRGDFTREAAQQITGASLMELKTLVDLAFLRRDPSTGRFAIHALIRQYATQQRQALGVGDDLDRKHADYYLHFLKQCEAGLMGNWQRKAIAHIEADFDDFQVGWQTAVAQGQIDLLHLALDGLYWFAFFRGFWQVTQSLFTEALRAAAASDDAQWRLLDARLTTRRFDTRAIPLEAVAASVTHVREAGQPGMLLGSLFTAGAIYKRRGEVQQAVALFEEVLAIAGDDLPEARFYRAVALGELAMTQLDTGNTEAGLSNINRSIALQKQNGDEIGRANSLKRLGYLYWVMGDYGQAITHLQDALSYQRSNSSSQAVAMSLAGLSALLMLDAQFHEAETTAHEAIDLAAHYNHDHAQGWALLTLGNLANVHGDYNEAIRLCERGRQLVEGTVDLIYDAHWGLSVAYVATGQMAQARASNQQTLAYSQTINSPAYMALYLPVTAAILAAEGQAAQAVSVLACALEHDAAPRSFLDRLPLVQQTMDRLVAALGAEAYLSAWREGATQDIQGVVANALA